MFKMIPENTDVTSLPWITLLTLACGYIGYYIANVGSRDHHKQIDVAFSSLVFGLVAVSIYQLAVDQFSNIYLATASSLFVVIVAGALWKVFGIKLLRSGLRLCRVSFADDVPQAWMSLFDAKAASELSVETKDGTIYLSQNLDNFRKYPNGPCVFGASGDVLLYATSIKKMDGDWEDQSDLYYEDWGVVITYIPATEVKRVRYRRL